MLIFRSRSPQPVAKLRGANTAGLTSVECDTQLSGAHTVPGARERACIHAGHVLTLIGAVDAKLSFANTRVA